MNLKICFLLHFFSLLDNIYFFTYKKQTDHVFSLLSEAKKYNNKSFCAQFQFLIEQKCNINEKYSFTVLHQVLSWISSLGVNSP